jgi:hypothetical protein
MLYEIIDELIAEQRKKGIKKILISYQNILDRIGKKTGAELQYGESRFNGLETQYYEIKRNEK